jgi:hypothetical protein
MTAHAQPVVKALNERHGYILSRVAIGWSLGSQRYEAAKAHLRSWRVIVLGLSDDAIP